MVRPKPRGTSNPGWRSGFEEKVAKDLTSRGVGFVFEGRKVKYTPPEKERTYTPDFELGNGVIIETKGYFTSEDRKKMRWVKEQHPELDIRLLFYRARNRINKGSNTTYADWCDRYGYIWAEGGVPQGWLDETPGD